MRGAALRVSGRAEPAPMGREKGFRKNGTIFCAREMLNRAGTTCRCPQKTLYLPYNKGELHIGASFLFYPPPQKARRAPEGKKFALNLPVQVQALKFPSLGLENQALALENGSRGWKTQAPALSLL